MGWEAHPILLVFLKSMGSPERELTAYILDKLLHDQEAASLARLGLWLF